MRIAGSDVLRVGQLTLIL